MKKNQLFTLNSLVLFMLILLSGCTLSNTTGSDLNDIEEFDTITAQPIMATTQSSGPTSIPTLPAAISITLTPPFSPIATPCPGESRFPLCYEVDVYLAGENEYFKNVELGCGPSGEMVVRFNADIRVTTDLDLIRDGIRQQIEINFACLSQIDFVKMDEEEISAITSFHEQNGPDDYYGRQWKKVNLTFVDGTVWEDVYLYDTCCYKTTSATVEESLQACVNSIGEGKVSGPNEGNLNDFDVTKIVIRRKEYCP